MSEKELERKYLLVPLDMLINDVAYLHKILTPKAGDKDYSGEYPFMSHVRSRQKGRLATLERILSDYGRDKILLTEYNIVLKGREGHVRSKQERFKALRSIRKRK